MNTIQIKGVEYPAVKAAGLKNGMIYWDGSKISNVVETGKTVKFVLAGHVDRTVRSTTNIALARN